MHRSDIKNEIRRKESLGYNFKTENLHPSAFRSPLLNKEGKLAPKYYLTAFVPILRESYRAEFNGTKRPKYHKLDKEETWIQDQQTIVDDDGCSEMFKPSRPNVHF